MAKRKKPVMRRNYFGLGIASMVAGSVFLAITLITTATILRVFVVGFFLVLGIIDLLLYAVFREH